MHQRNRIKARSGEQKRWGEREREEKLGRNCPFLKKKTRELSLFG